MVRRHWNRSRPKFITVLGLAQVLALSRSLILHRELPRHPYRGNSTRCGFDYGFVSATATLGSDADPGANLQATISFSPTSLVTSIRWG
jgi:hypothetical protein